MPEASVNEDHSTPRAKHDIRTAGKVDAVKTISVAKAVQKAAHNHFRLRVLVSDAPHVHRALLDSKAVHIRSRARTGVPGPCVLRKWA